MIELLHQLDIRCFDLLNGAHSPFWDAVMETVSSRSAWLPLYALMLFFAWRQLGWKACLLMLAWVILLAVATDQLSASLIKPLAERYRPCRPEAGLDIQIYTLNGHCGGKYGFVSSHAANLFGLMSFMSLIYRRRAATIVLLGLAALAGYSRIYLGVHYPGDVLCGAALGALLAWGAFEGFRRSRRLLPAG